ncbi:MAG: hypothetical protein IT258_22625 [Saprospiraceae bacterium]|nr:hypothetical protein [Saprospiraceae bacterium]
MNKLLHRPSAYFHPSVCRKAVIFQADFAGKIYRQGHPPTDMLVHAA